jgi:hypothetical protein
MDLSLCGARVAGKPAAWQTAGGLFDDYAARWNASVSAPANGISLIWIRGFTTWRPPPGGPPRRRLGKTPGVR